MQGRLVGAAVSAALGFMAVVAGPAVAGAAHAARTQRTLTSLLAKQIRSVNHAAHAPAVLLPSFMPLDAKHLWPSGGAAGSAYALSIGAVRHCDGANACFVAEFTATKARSVFGKRVRVRGASKAGFTPLSCGASCSPPQIDFLVSGVRYTIQANLKSRHGDRAALIEAAQSAISAGPR
jgi:hypothetical protein